MDQNSVIERAARALCKEQLGMFAWDKLSSAGRQNFIICTRAVIAAIREPSEGMLEQGSYQIPSGGGSEEVPMNREDAEACWRAMIDVALAEGK